MRILIGCELSGVVRRAFRAKGHKAYSCDLKPSDDASVYHLQMHIFDAIDQTAWDLIIMHPPCTALAVCGNRTYGLNRDKSPKEKHYLRIEAIEWTIKLWDYARDHCPRVCMENPVGVLPIEPTQYIQPWQFGHGETKKTGLWLFNLPKLKPTNIVEGREPRVHRMSPSKDRAKMRSQTYQGIADAMVGQWGRNVP